MIINYVDIILLVILGYFVFRGFRSGFVRIIGGFVGIVAGAYLAGRFYDLGAGLLIERFPALNATTAIVLAFIVIYAAVNIVISLAVRILMAVFHIIPLATTVNRIIGAALGALEAFLLIGLVIWIATLFPFQNAFANTLRESTVAGYFEKSTQLVQPLLPNGLRNINFETLQNWQNREDQAKYLQEHMPSFFKHLQNRAHDMEDRVQEDSEESGTTTNPDSI